jgi:HD-GYP domain-containing protein (c-di-GMP phosphodiesterase class II)
MATPQQGLKDTPLLEALFERANQAAANTALDGLLEASMQLLADVCRAKSGLIYLYRAADAQLHCRLGFGALPAGACTHVQTLPHTGLGWQAVQQKQPRLVTLSPGEAWQADLPALQGLAQENLLAVPFLSAETPAALCFLFDCQSPDLPSARWLSDRLASDIQRAVRLEDAERLAERMQAMVSIFEQIGSTLDRDQLLHTMIEAARQVINAEACSLFLVDSETGENVLHLASNIDRGISLGGVRVPPGKGIIGSVVDSGENVLVPDVTQDERHYRNVDMVSGFNTRAILAVPLRSRTVPLGDGRGVVSTRVIGGFEAINKARGTFDDQDAGLLNMLANQAATVLQIADLYGDANQLFIDVVRALAEAIDAKDPYTEGHSQRVSDFAVAIAHELGLADEFIHRVRIGSLMHDVGKIGIPDGILVKPGKLTPAEYGVMKQHPAIGARIMGLVRKLQAEVPAISEHHERLDGSGYPNGLSGDAISPMGRIVATADVFDAMTSNRPYRAALPVDEVLDHLKKESGRHFDKGCVQALLRAHQQGLALTQPERDAWVD